MGKNTRKAESLSSVIRKKKRAITLRVYQLAREQGLTSDLAIARKAGVSNSNLSDILGGERNWTRKTLAAVAYALGVDMGELIGDDGDEAEPEARVREEAHGFSVTHNGASVLVRAAFHCPRCHAEVAFGLAECPHCGQRLHWQDATALNG